MPNDNKLAQFADVNALFAASLDDLADLPSFEAPAPGAYILDVSLDVKEVGGKQCVEAGFVVVELVEAADPEAKVAVPGTNFNTLFMLGNEFGVGNLKKFLAPFAAHFGTNNIGDLVTEHVKNVRIAGSVKNRKDKEDPTKVYASVDNVVIG